MPKGVHIVPVWPGKTLGGIAFLSYERGSTLVYHELCIVAALVRVGRRFGFWLPHLDVDNDAPLEGGRTIWGLPKRIAAFELDQTARQLKVTVREAERLLCLLAIRDARVSRWFGLPSLVPLPAVSLCGGRARFFTARFAGRIAPAHVTVEAPPDGPIAALGLRGRPLLTVRFNDLRLTVPPPHADIPLPVTQTLHETSRDRHRSRYRGWVRVVRSGKRAP